MHDIHNDFEIENILEENRKRHEIINAPYNPVTGLGAVGERKKISIKDSPIGDMYLPVELIKENLFIRRLAKYGSKDILSDLLKKWSIPKKP